jgi:hypothetical protein
LPQRGRVFQMRDEFVERDHTVAVIVELCEHLF